MTKPNHAFSAPEFIPETHIKHAFFTRKGGVSSGLYQSLNVGRGSKDHPDNVTRNREIIKNTLNAKRLIFPHQSHSTDVVIIDEHNHHSNPQADALVTNIPNVALAIQTADCVPILFADNVNGIIGAAHAGWRGAKNGIIRNICQTMIQIGAQKKTIKAIVGPAISAPNYEVDHAFYASFMQDNRNNTRFFEPSPNRPNTHYQFNLPHYVLEALQSEDIQNHHINLCTYQEENLFFSYRRATHKHENDYGRHVSAIMSKTS